MPFKTPNWGKEKDWRVLKVGAFDEMIQMLQQKRLEILRGDQEYSEYLDAFSGYLDAFGDKRKVQIKEPLSLRTFYSLQNELVELNTKLFGDRKELEERVLEIKELLLA